MAGPAHSRIPKKRTPLQGVGKRQLLMGVHHASNRENISDLLINPGICDELNGIVYQPRLGIMSAELDRLTRPEISHTLPDPNLPFHA